MRIPYVCLILAAAAACTQGSEPTGPDTNETAFNAQGVGRPIKDRYIVTFRSSVADVRGEGVAIAAQHGGRVLFTYEYALRGIALEIPAQRLDALRRNPRVERVTPDGVLLAAGVQAPTPSWGLDRLDQRTRPMNGSYTYPGTGAGVRVYVLDSGLRTTHSDFAGRIGTGYSVFTSGLEDCNGHGTHVAGTAGGTTFGVAKGVTIIPIRLLDCEGAGSKAGFIAGVDWMIAHRLLPAVANASLQYGPDVDMDQAINNAVNSGIVFVVAAGNYGSDACLTSPSRVPAALTVAATDSFDVRGTFPSGNRSNWGACVDLFAPGVAIKSAWHTSTGATNILSGTSMATPHVAGAAALYLAGHPSASPAAVATALLSAATVDLVTDPGLGTPNRLLYAGAIVAPPLPPGNLAATTVGPTSVTITWSTGAAGASTIIDYRVRGAPTWVSSGIAPPGATSRAIAGLVPCTAYDVRARHTNGAESPLVVADSLFRTTAPAGQLCPPVNFRLTACSTSLYGGKTYATYTLGWTNGVGRYEADWQLAEGTTSSVGSATVIRSQIVKGPGFTTAIGPLLVTPTASPRYHWIRHFQTGTGSPWVALQGGPISPSEGCAL